MAYSTVIRLLVSESFGRAVWICCNTDEKQQKSEGKFRNITRMTSIGQPMRGE